MEGNDGNELFRGGETSGTASQAPAYKEFKPYIPASAVTPELTVTSIVIGTILAVIFGAANAYLGLRVGMTVSASIPAAVISMGVIRVLLRRDSILESNIVQTIGSAGESLAAGAIFTMPVFFLWSAEGLSEVPTLLEIGAIALCGGILGILFMVPLRRALIVKEHGVLPYPEGTACAEVLLAGENAAAGSAKGVFWGMGLAALYKLVIDGFRLVNSALVWKIRFLKTELSAEVYPALIAVGYICGPRISAYMFAGGLLGWLVLIPLIMLFGSDMVLYPGTAAIGEMYALGGASAIWSSYIRYIGAGAVAAGGIISLIKSLPLIITTFRDTLHTLDSGRRGTGAPEVMNCLRTERDMNMKAVLAGIVILIAAVWLLPVVPVNLLGAVLIAVFGFFFATVSSRMVGLVGSSNNPVSGMAIATLLAATLCLKLSGDTGIHGMQGAIAIGSIICIVAGMAGDTSQDLKTGYILGATPRAQQIGELIGTVAAALCIGAVLMLLNSAWGFGSEELAAPQATLMKMIVEGVMGGTLPYHLVLIGVGIALAVELLGVPVLPVAIGLYLPLELSACILLGGAIRLYVMKRSFGSEERRKAVTNRGLLFCSGMIAGEGIVGILLAVAAVFAWDSYIDLSAYVSDTAAGVGSAVLLGVIILSVLRFLFAGERRTGGTRR